MWSHCIVSNSKMQCKQNPHNLSVKQPVMYGQLDSRKLNKSDAPHNRSVKTNNVQCNAQQKMRQLSLVLKNNLTMLSCQPDYRLSHFWPSFVQSIHVPQYLSVLLITTINNGLKLFLQEHLVSYRLFLLRSTHFFAS